MGSNPVAGELIRREIRKQTPRQEGQVKTDMEAGVMQPQARDARSRQEWEDQERLVLQHLPRENGPTDSWISDFQPPEL